MIRIVRLRFKDEHINDFKQFFESRKELIKASEGCSHLELWQDCDDPNLFITYSLWNNITSLNQYRNSDLFLNTWATVKPWFNRPPEAFSAEQLILV